MFRGGYIIFSRFAPAQCRHEDRENRSKSQCFCQTRGRDFLAAHTWQSALAARNYGNEAQEGSSGPFRTLKEFARLRRGSVTLPIGLQNWNHRFAVNCVT